MTSSQWAKLHPIRWKRMQQKYRHSIPFLCHCCKSPVPSSLRKNGNRFCSQKCRKNSAQISTKNRRKKISDEFSSFKQGIGCKRCGFCECGACLDFHHKDPLSKITRLSAGLWRYSPNKFKTEMEKCVLLCKNCHYRIHNEQRRDTIDNENIQYFSTHHGY